MTYRVYHHKNENLADYLIECSSELTRAKLAGQIEVLSLPQQTASKGFARLPPALRSLLFFARPDAVICLDDGSKPEHPVFAVEITNHVPAQDHWMQRFNHLVGCALQGVPGAYIMPFGMPNHAKFKSVLDHVFFYAYERVTEIHRCPMFIAEWEVIDGKTTRCDPDPNYSAQPDRNTADMRLVFGFLDSVLDFASHGRPLSSLANERLFVRLRDRVRRKAYAKVPQLTDFQRLKVNHPKNQYLSNTEFEDWLDEKGLDLPPDFPQRLRLRDQYLVWTPQVITGSKSRAKLRAQLNTRIDKKGGDPYFGQPLAFDYIFCRLGETPYQRDVSLVLDLSILEFGDLAKYHRKIWDSSPLQHTSLEDIEDIPTYNMYLKEGELQLMKNVLRVCAYAADVIVYRDGVVYS